MMPGLSYHKYLSAFALTLLVLILSIPADLSAQNEKSALQNEKKQILEEIAYSNKILAETSKNKKSNMNSLVVLQQKIRQRERLINNGRAEIRLLDREIEEAGDSIFQLNVELKKLKEEYASMIYYAYRNRNSYDRLVFIFSSDDFNQAYRRVKYFQQYGTYRRTQAELITRTQIALTEKEQRLEQQKAEKQSLLARQEVEKQTLEHEKTEVNGAIQNLSQQEKGLKASIRAKEKAVKKLEDAIARIIAEEIRLAEERARAAADATKTSSGFSLTPEELVLSENFASNKGKLPWPTERGVVSSTFGEHQHPVLPRVKVKNNGIDILTSEGEFARAVFNGEVTRVISVPNFNNVVIIRHGEYLTVYSNLDEVLVSKGETVITKQRIGRIYTDRNENKTEMHFEVWKAKDLMNPASWLARKR